MLPGLTKADNVFSHFFFFFSPFHLSWLVKARLKGKYKKKKNILSPSQENEIK